MTTIGARINTLRTEKGYTQEQLALLIKKTKSNVSGYEHDKFEPSAKTIISLCDVFNVSADYLLFGVEHVVPKIEQNKITDIPSEDINLAQKINRLSHDEKMKIDGIIDGLLIARELYNKKAPSLNLTHGEDAATDETA
ncbi:helix-turn-helix domain-containing protein [Metasolibacillus meyeri]|uniref:helix-turn-helix domain-containing protein n=1 Tax=Metasolibacillus meyeri TaxID=1071052 RepID=UPI00187D4E06|nr:helix-turn-helix domain-containing protein [Metasolibacillus meyeri]